MKILYLHPRAWTGEYPILRRLRERGHEVCVLEENRRMSTARAVTHDFEQPGDGIRTFWYHPSRGLERLLTWPWDRYYRRAFDGRKLAHRIWIAYAAIRLFAPDVVIASDGFSYAVPAAWLRRVGLLRAPLVVSYIGGDILDYPEAQVGRRRSRGVNQLIRQVIKAADVLRPVSPLVKDALIYEGALESRIVICPSHLVADDTRLADIFSRRLEKRASVRARLGIAEDAPLIITLSGNLEGKGLHILAAAWKDVIAAIPQARWLLCGPSDQWLDKAVWPQLKADGLLSTVIAGGFLRGEDVFAHLAAADLHVNPSLGESLNMVTVEAAAVGTPTVGSDRAGIKEWITQFDTGIVVPAGEAAQLADAIIRALGEDGLLTRFGSACRDMAAEFSLDRITGQLESIFEKACATP